MRDRRIANSSLRVNPDGTVSWFNGRQHINLGVVTIEGLGYRGDLRATRNIGRLADLNAINTAELVNRAVTDYGFTPVGRGGRAQLNSRTQAKVIATLRGVTGYPSGAKLFATVSLRNRLTTRDIALQIREVGRGTSLAEVITPVSGNTRRFSVFALAGGFSRPATRKNFELLLRWYGATQDVTYHAPLIIWESAKK